MCTLAPIMAGSNVKEQVLERAFRFYYYPARRADNDDD